MSRRRFAGEVITMKSEFFQLLGVTLLLATSLSAAVYQESGGVVAIEAEHFDSRTRHVHADGQDHHWHVAPTDDGTDFLADFADPFLSARGESYIQVLPNGPGGGGPNIDPKAIYKAFIQTPGLYRLYIRWRGASGSDDSLYASIATLSDGTGGTIADWYRYSQASGTDFAASWQGLAGFERTDASGNDTAATWQISTPGIYTIVISQREDGAAVDSIVLQLSNLAAPGEPGPAESSISTTFPPSITSISPTGTGVAPATPIRIEIADGGAAQVSESSVQLSLNGSSLSRTVQRNGAVTTVTATPPVLPAGSTNEITLVFSDTASPANSFTHNFTFVVANYPTLSAAISYPATSADQSAPGFKARVVQANTASGTLANTISRAEAQLAGTLIDPATQQPYTNDANTTGAGADGFFADADVINWSEDAGVGTEFGSFQGPTFPDEPIPGIPGVDGVNTDNIAAEILTFLELSPGAYTLGVNSDDGFSLGVASDARDVFRTVVGQFDGGRGATDSTFSFVVDTAGLYSFRLLWFEGGGDANLEFFSVDPATGEKILINDRNNPKAIKAWRQVTAPSRPFISAVSPAPKSVDVPVETAIGVTFQNGATTINTNSIQLKLAGQSVPLTSVTTSGSAINVVADPAGNLSSITDYTAEISYTDSANNTITRSFTFTTIRAAIALPPLRQDDTGLVVIEAENFDANVPQGAHTWTFVKTPAGYSGDGTMYASPDAPGAVVNYPDSLTTSPRLDFKVSFTKTGTHYFWFRGSDGGGNSLNAGINGDVGPTDNLSNIDQGCCGTRLVPNGTTFTWVGGNGTGRAQFEVAQAGVHTINVWMREDGQIVDKVLITTDVNFTPTGAGPAESARVGDPFPPTITITSPTPDQQIAAGSTVTITVDATDRDGTISKVEFFEGGNKIGEDTAAPFSFDFKPTQEKPYTFTAKATDNSGLTATSGGVKIIFGNPPAVLFVSSANPPTDAGDIAVVNRLEGQGFLVTVVDDNVSDTAQSDGKALVVISSTVGSGNVAAKFTDVVVPVINWEEAIFDDLKMTGDSGADPDHHGSTGGLTQIDILNASHPLAAGLSGTVTVTSSPQTMSWGVSDANPTNAIVVAQVAGDPTKWAIWAYDKGGTLFDGTAAAERRVGFFFNAGSVNATTPDGFKLFDAALNWSLRRDVQLAPQMSISKTGDQISISWTNGGVLEWTSALTPGATWTPMPNAPNPYTEPANQTMRFFRVRK